MVYAMYANYPFDTRCISYDGVTMVIWINRSQRETSQILPYYSTGDEFVVSSAKNRDMYRLK